MIVVGLFLLLVTGFCLRKKQWELSFLHLLFVGMAVVCFWSAFLPLSSIKVGLDGLSAEIDRARAEMKVLETVVTTGTPETRDVIDALSSSARIDDWVTLAYNDDYDVPESEGEIPPSESETSTYEIPESVKNLQNEGVIDVEKDGFEVKIRVRPEYVGLFKGE